MKHFLNDRGLLVCAFATALLVGCESSSPIVSTPFASARSDAMGPPGVPSAVHPNAVATVVTILYGGKPILRGSKAWLLNDQDEIIRQDVTDADGIAGFRNVPQTLALKLKYLAKYITCKGEFPNRECSEKESLYEWPGLGKVHAPPFPATLECDDNAIRELCKKR